MSVEIARIDNTLGKFDYHLSNHNSVCVGVSGGSDSNIIVHIVATYFRSFLPRIHFAFNNTGLEYSATKRHLDFMENRYGIKIDRIRGESVVSVVHREGFPILSKEFSQTVNGVSRGVPSLVRKLDRNGTSYAFSPKQKALADYLITNRIMVSDKCCNLSKKKPFHDYMKEHKCDLHVSGERRCEGGIRATRYTSCFQEGKSGKIDKFIPLYYWNDDTKQWYKEHERIIYSDCYEIWGMKRTGCVGCPFNSRIGDDLKRIKQYEPLMFKACMSVFGQSYEIMDRFNVRRQPILEMEDAGSAVK